MQPWIAFLGPIGFACPFLVGLWAGRRRVLEQPERHRRLLVTTAIVGIDAAMLGAQPVARALAGYVPLPDPDTPFLLDLSGTMTVATTALLTAFTWGLTVVMADRMRRAGRRGPFEVAVRRVTYWRSA